MLMVLMVLMMLMKHHDRLVTKLLTFLLFFLPCPIICRTPTLVASLPLLLRVAFLCGVMWCDVMWCPSERRMPSDRVSSQPLLGRSSTAISCARRKLLWRSIETQKKSTQQLRYSTYVHSIIQPRSYTVLVPVPAPAPVPVPVPVPVPMHDL